MKLLSCPKCHAVVVVADDLTDADLVKCPVCSAIDFLMAYRDKATAVATGDLRHGFLDSLAQVVDGIDTLKAVSTVDAFVKETCKGYGVSPWAVVSAMNALLFCRYQTAPAHNPAKWVRLVPHSVSLDSVYEALCKAVAEAAAAPSAKDPASAPAASAPAKGDAEIWRIKYLDQKKQYDELDQSYNELLAEWQRLREIVDRYGLD